jgi:hypothetical protein
MAEALDQWDLVRTDDQAVHKFFSVQPTVWNVAYLTTFLPICH